MLIDNMISFGPFRLFASGRRLLRDEVPLDIGSPSLDILIALVERAGEVVGKKELVARAWPDVVVGESSLRSQVRGLRKALGDGRGTRYIANIPGRGYCFVAPITRAPAPKPPAAEPLPAERPQRLPARLARMIGRDEAVAGLCTQLLKQRFVSIVGPGGMGKTTVASSFGCSPHRFVMLRRVERSQGLLLTTDAPLHQIALECGLADQSHFSRTFLRFVGETPAKWRKARATHPA